MAFLHERQSIWVSSEVAEKVRYLMLKYPNDYNSIASVFRAGVMVLHAKRVKNDGK